MKFKNLLKAEKARQAKINSLIKTSKKTDNDIAAELKNSGRGLLASDEWKKLRRKVIAKYGGKCAKCGVVPNDPKKVNVDHIKPRKFFPELSLDESNLQVLCCNCNKKKGNADWNDYRKFVLS